MAPPKQRTKARMHASFSLIKWGLKLADYFRTPDAQALPQSHQQMLSWILKYEDALLSYGCMVELCRTALNLVHERGYYRKVKRDFMVLTKPVSHFSRRCMAFRNKIAAILAEEGAKVPVGQHYLGSSEVIESVFGKFKAMEDQHASSGLTSLVMALPALAGDITHEIVECAMNSVSVDIMSDWMDKNMGATFLSQRRQNLRSAQ